MIEKGGSSAVHVNDQVNSKEVFLEKEEEDLTL